VDPDEVSLFLGARPACATLAPKTSHQHQRESPLGSLLLSTVYLGPFPLQALPGPRNSDGRRALGFPAPGVVPHHLRWCPWRCTLSCCRGLLEPSSLPTTLRCQYEVSTQWMRRGWSMRCRRASASDRCRVGNRYAVHPRPRTIGTSPGSLSWLCESPATPVLAAHGPGNHGGVAGGPVHQISLVPRKLVFSDVRASPVTSHVRALPVTPGVATYTRQSRPHSAVSANPPVSARQSCLAFEFASLRSGNNASDGSRGFRHPIVGHVKYHASCPTRGTDFFSRLDQLRHFSLRVRIFSSSTRYPVRVEDHDSQEPLE
jgi:hypothetical protein